MSQLRKDIQTGEWTILAKQRDGRPYLFNTEDSSKECPFCLYNKHMTPGEVFRLHDVRVVPNKFPAVCQVCDENLQDMLFYAACEGIGHHEVVIETSEHNLPFDELDIYQIQDILKVFKKRFVILSQEPDVEYVQIFKNHGRNAGASLPHSHSQVVALPFIPPRVEQEMKNADTYYNTTGRCVYCDILKEEHEEKGRLLYHNEHVTVALSFAPRFAYEAILIPNAHQWDFGTVEDNVLAGLAEALIHTIHMMQAILGQFPYNLVLHTTPLGSENTHYHWHVELIPRVSYHAGFEIATGTCINTVCPEEAAQGIKKAKKTNC